MEINRSPPHGGLLARSRQWLGRWRRLAAALVFAGLTPLACAFDPASAGIDDIQEAYATGMTVPQVIGQYLERIQKLDRGPAGLNSITSLAPDVLLQAQLLERERRQQGPRGPLHGIPVLVKDNLDVRGLPTTNGYAFLRSHIAERDSAAVQRLREAGAVILGKTNMPDGARGFDTVSSAAGRTHHPKDRALSVGGSSGGSAVAVSAGLAPVALGTDSLGSIRVPASHLGIHGLRPTIGLVDRAGAFPGAGHRNVIGPFARHAQDLKPLMDALAPHAPRPALAAASSPTAGSGLKGLRIGIYTAYAEDPLVAPQVAATLHQLAQRLRRGGAKVFAFNAPPPEIEPPPRRAVVGQLLFDMDQYLRQQSASSPVRSSWSYIRKGVASGQMSMLEGLYLAIVRALPWWHRPLATETHHMRFVQARQKAAAEFEAAAFGAQGAGLHLLVFPTAARMAPTIGQDPGLLGVIEPSLLGLPVLTLPGDRSPDGHAIGIDLLGPRHSEQHLIEIATALSVKP